ncbi:hypothetical protein LY625_02760 [Lysobacter sp. GX 14042]|uniref:hypothetical protein n=1 Tax=Lysobacter sp. GX 14042 TaxID=2907155 RepID=UPI001F43EF3E|nr:hypothetical protein [Lysobacter sp. GX 14042]MCE7031550.1 hypothetical protein [Lysobacter sp. GX 14042]
MKHILFLVAIGLGLFFSVTGRAEAQQWVLCTNCSTTAQFQTAAISKAPDRTGEFRFAVGNPNTGTMKHVIVFKTMPGEVPRGGSAPIPQKLTLGGLATDAVGFIANEDEAAVTIPEDPQLLAGLMGPTFGQTNAVVSSATPAEQQQFGAIVKLSKNSIMVSAPNSSGFSSLRGAQMEVVSPFLYSAMAAGANPAWQAAEIPSFWKGLFNALKSLHGKGPTACIVYRNGDSACYQLNIMDKNAARYITDSGKDANGQPIPQTGGIGGGGGGSGLNVQPNRPSTGYISWSRPSSSYLVCSYIGGKLHSCYIQPL